MACVGVCSPRAAAVSELLQRGVQLGVRSTGTTMSVGDAAGGRGAAVLHYQREREGEHRSGRADPETQLVAGRRAKPPRHALVPSEARSANKIRTDAYPADRKPEVPTNWVGGSVGWRPDETLSGAGSFISRPSSADEIRVGTCYLDKSSPKDLVGAVGGLVQALHRAQFRLPPQLVSAAIAHRTQRSVVRCSHMNRRTSRRGKQ